MRRANSVLSHVVPWLLLVLSLAPLAAWAYLGTFTRYLADDYSTSYHLQKSGFWQAQVFWYETWSGRYSFTFLISLVELAGIVIVPWLPFVALLAWFASLFWALKQIVSALGIPVEKKWLGILSGAIIFGVVRSLPNYSEVVFWQTGILTYQVTNIFLALSLALFLKRFFSQPETPKVVPWEYLIAFIIAFLAGGFSETAVVVQVAILTLGLLYFSFYKNPTRNDILRVLLAAYLGSWCSLVAIVRAPGNLTRNASLAGLSLESLSVAFLSSLSDIPVFLFEWVRDNTALVFVLLVTGVFTGFFAAQPAVQEKANRDLRRGFLLFGAACAVLSAGFFPAFVAWGSRPPDRAIFVPMFIFVWAYVLFGFLAGYLLNSYLKFGRIRTGLRAFMLLSLVVAMIWMQARTVFASLQMVPALRTYVQLWDERDAYLRQASMQNKGPIVIPSLRRNPALHDLRDTIWLTGELSETPDNWINVAASYYYRVHSISGK